MRLFDPFGRPFVKEAVRYDIVEYLDDRAPQHARGPLALDHAFINLGDNTVAKRIVVSGVDDRRCRGQTDKQVSWERRHALHRDCDRKIFWR